jgi:archaeal flagellar protein FlaJ
MKRKGKAQPALEEPVQPVAPASPPNVAPSGAAPVHSAPPVMVAARMVQPLLIKAPPKMDKKKAPPKPQQRGLTEFQRTAFRVFGPGLARKPADMRLAESLSKSRAGVRAEALKSAAMLAGILGGVSGGMMTLMFLGVFVPLLGIELPMTTTIVFLMVPMFMGLGGYLAIIASPSARAKARGKDIDNRLPYALNYIAAMASAGVNIDTIFKSLAEQKIYGEVAREAEAIYRDITLFGKDTVTAFKRGIARTPSQRFAELLQGAITTFGSGGDLQVYFSSKAQRFMIENRQVQKQYVDTMGLMAETYVTTAVAGPLFLMVMMAIMGMLSGGGPGQMYLIVYMMLPCANFGFVYGLQAMTPKV